MKSIESSLGARQPFARFVRVLRSEGTREALTRIYQNASGRALSWLRRPDWSWLPSQDWLLSDLFQDEFTLIILDACRFDFFRDYAHRILAGDLKPAYSPASHTLAWLKSVVPKNARFLREAIIYSSNPNLNSKDISMRGFKAREFIPQGIFDLWEWAWDARLQTVTPDAVVRAVLEGGLRERNIVWFLQPHFPYIGDTSILLPREVMNMGGVQTANRYFAKLVREGILSRPRLEAAYRDNLLLVLKAVRELLEESSPEGRVIITSDHGELLGEYGYYAHPEFLNLPQQRIVPWFAIP